MEAEVDLYPSRVKRQFQANAKANRASVETALKTYIRYCMEHSCYPIKINTLPGTPFSIMPTPLDLEWLELVVGEMTFRLNQLDGTDHKYKVVAKDPMVILSVVTKRPAAKRIRLSELDKMPPK
jgi:hypothetical protein